MSNQEAYVSVAQLIHAHGQPNKNYVTDIDIVFCTPFFYQIYLILEF